MLRINAKNVSSTSWCCQVVLHGIIKRFHKWSVRHLRPGSRELACVALLPVSHDVRHFALVPGVIDFRGVQVVAVVRFFNEISNIGSLVIYFVVRTIQDAHSETDTV